MIFAHAGEEHTEAVASSTGNEATIIASAVTLVFVIAAIYIVFKVRKSKASAKVESEE